MLGCFRFQNQDNNFKAEIQEEKRIFQDLVRVTLRLPPILINQPLCINRKTVSRFIWKAGS